MEGAFDKVLDGVVYIEHIASPLPRPTEDVHRDIILPAIHGTTSILTSALKAASVKRVVITSSLVAIVPGDALANGDMTNVYGPNSRVSPLPTAPWGTDIWGAYRNAKVLALEYVFPPSHPLAIPYALSPSSPTLPRPPFPKFPGQERKKLTNPAQPTASSPPTTPPSPS